MPKPPSLTGKVDGAGKTRVKAPKPQDSQEKAGAIQGEANPEANKPTGQAATNKLSDQLAILVTSWQAVIAVITAIATIAGITYGVVKFVDLGPTERENTRLKTDIDAAQKQVSALQTQLAQAETSARQLAATSDIPVLIEPAAGASMISTQLRFTWNYPKSRPAQPYVVEVINIRNGQVKIFPYQVPSPGKQELNIRNLNDLVGQNFWRVGTGTTASRDSLDHIWSRYGEFSFYLSTGDRIMDTKKLRIGTHTLNLPTPFNCRDNAGNRAGFDIELIRWISARLQLEPEFVDLNWEDLMPAVKRNDVDIACGSIGASKKRETKEGVKFSVGYLEAHMGFFGLRQKQNFPSDLSGATVAVAPGTTNREAAKFLEPRFGFKVKDDYPNYSSIYNDVDAGKVDFVVFDSILADLLSGGKYIRYGPLLINI